MQIRLASSHKKILIHRRRDREERAKDILYMHDTIETFAMRINDLRAEWGRNIRRELHANSVRTVQGAAASLFGEVNDSIRAAARIVQARNLTPEAIRETCTVRLYANFSTRTATRLAKAFTADLLGEFESFKDPHSRHS